MTNQDGSRRFRLVDVFHDQPMSGNPLAVVHDTGDLDGEAMQALARWLNFSETSFLLPPDTAGADYRVRIFTPERELPFAGHPTLGSCHAWLAAGGIPSRDAEVIQECGAGLVTIRRGGDRLAFASPPLVREGPVDPARLAAIADFLRIAPDTIVDAQWADNGPGWLVVLLRSAQAVLDLEPRRHSAARVDVGVVGPHRSGHACAFEVRAFFTDALGGVREDPVTGSLNASAAQWLIASGQVTSPYIASQGTRMGRRGRVYIDQDHDGTVWVGGNTSTLFTAERVKPR